MPATAAAFLDSGNVAFRVKQYPVAQRFYEQAAQAAPDQAAPWYGVFMVAQAVGNTKLADSAMKMVSRRSGGGDLMASDMGKAHAGTGSGAGGGTAGDKPAGALPEGHPAIKR